MELKTYNSNTTNFLENMSIGQELLANFLENMK